MSKYTWPVTIVIVAVILVGGAIVTALVLHHGPAATPVATASGTASTSTAQAAASSSAATSAPAVTTSSPAASTSAAPLTDVTVCSDPVGSCGGEMRTEPAQLLTSGDGSGYVRAVTWSDWGDPTASGAGTLEIDNCRPNCAQGHFTGYPATITVSGLTPYGSGKQAYADMTITAPSSPAGPYHYKKLLP
jgi:hypothetical protein